MGVPNAMPIFHMLGMQEALLPASPAYPYGEFTTYQTARGPPPGPAQVCHLPVLNTHRTGRHLFFRRATVQSTVQHDGRKKEDGDLL